MRFCMPHWNALREAIEKRGLTSLISESGAQAAAKFAREADTGKSTVDTYDPLMGAHWAIINNLVTSYGPGIFLIDGCPMCHANEMHEKYCTTPNCPIDKVKGYDKWIDNAADDQLRIWKEITG